MVVVGVGHGNAVWTWHTPSHGASRRVHFWTPLASAQRSTISSRRPRSFRRTGIFLHKQRVRDGCYRRCPLASSQHDRLGPNSRQESLPSVFRRQTSRIMKPGPPLPFSATSRGPRRPNSGTEFDRWRARGVRGLRLPGPRHSQLHHSCLRTLARPSEGLGARRREAS